MNGKPSQWLSLNSSHHSANRVEAGRSATATDDESQRGGGRRGAPRPTGTDATSPGDAAGSGSGAATAGGDPADGGTVGGSRCTRARCVSSFIASSGIFCPHACCPSSLVVEYIAPAPEDIAPAPVVQAPTPVVEYFAGRGVSGSLLGSPPPSPEQCSTAQECTSERVVEHIVAGGDSSSRAPRRGGPRCVLHGFPPVQGSEVDFTVPLGDADEGFFRTFPLAKKSAKVGAQSRSELAAHSSSSTPGAYGVVSSFEEPV